MVSRLMLAGLAALTGCGDNLGGSDRFAPLPDRSEGLVNLSADLDQVLEGGALHGACDRYAAGDGGDRRARLLCGKEMFFYESFDTIGAPAALIDHLVAHYPDEVGPGFERYGMVRDPASDLPLGLTPTVPLAEGVPGYAFTCASCHFARLPDGRFSVGAPNHGYQYGRQILAMAIFPAVAIGLSQPEEHPPEAIAAIQPLLDRVDSDPVARDALIEVLTSLAGVGAAPAFTPEIERYHATWPPGTQDFAIAPLPIDDEIHTISKIIDLWDLPGDDEVAASGMPHAMLAWTGAARSLADFVAGFAVIGGEDPWPAERLAPLVEYVESLRSPDNPDPPDPALVAEGEQLFADSGCGDCHGGPRGGGTRLFDFEEIGTDDAMARWLDADGDGQPCCDVELTAPLTGQIKSPRLTGMWAKQRFLHNGALASLDELFCADGDRGAVTEPAYGDGGHMMTCDLQPGEKRALIAYLLAH